MKQSIFIILLLFVFLISANAEKRDTALTKQLGTHLLVDGKNFVISPLHWQKTDWILFSSLSIATGAIILWGDQPIYNFANTLHSKKRDAFSNHLEPIGNTYSYIAIGAIMSGGLIWKNNYAMETACIAIESCLLGAVCARAVKTIAGRVRPNSEGTTNSLQWYGPFIENPIFNQVSFFSGHTTTAFSIASVFAHRYRNIKWVPYVAYGLASLGGIQRIYSNKHWASDVFAGAVVGTATGIFLSKQWEETPIRFYPVVNNKGAVLSVVIPLR